MGSTEGSSTTWSARPRRAVGVAERFTDVRPALWPSCLLPAKITWIRVLPPESAEVDSSPSHWDVVRWTKRMSIIIPSAPPTRTPFEMHNHQFDFPGGKALDCKNPGSE